MALLCLLLSHNELFARLPETAFKNQIMASALWNSFSGPFVWPLHTTSFVADQTSQLIAASFLSFSLFWWRWGRESTLKDYWLTVQRLCLEVPEYSQGLIHTSVSASISSFSFYSPNHTGPFTVLWILQSFLLLNICISCNIVLCSI